MFSLIVVFAFVGPRPVYWCVSLRAVEVAIFAEGPWLSRCWSMGTPFGRILGRVSGPGSGEEALKPAGSVRP